LAITASKGSKQVKYFREQQEKLKAQEKHWELAGTRIGEIMGVKAKEEQEPTESTNYKYEYFFWIFNESKSRASLSRGDSIKFSSPSPPPSSPKIVFKVFIIFRVFVWSFYNCNPGYLFKKI